MSEVFARVELHEGPNTKPDYDVLHIEMNKVGFSRYRTDDANQAAKQVLPTGMYVRLVSTAVDMASLTQQVRKAADDTGFSNCGVVIGLLQVRTFGLETVKPPDGYVIY
jgi:hypothetical protein